MICRQTVAPIFDAAIFSLFIAELNLSKRKMLAIYLFTPSTPPATTYFNFN